MKFSTATYVIFIFLSNCNAEDITEEQLEVQQTALPPPIEQDYELLTYADVEKTIEQIEVTAALAQYRENTLPKEEIARLYDEIAKKIDDLLGTMDNYNVVYGFILAKGMDRLVTPNIGIFYTPLQKRLLILLKTLFDVAPTTTKVVIPLNIVDRLLDIFENNSNLALKAYALDVLYVWLPDNPKVQARVMKLKGLEPFYRQIAKLDVSVIHTLLDIFNKILTEHINVRSEKYQKTKADYEKLEIYNKIGLIERMSTPEVCDGLLKIFEATWSYQNDDNKLLVPVLSLIRNVKNFCLSTFKNQTKAVNLFTELSKYIKDIDKNEYSVKYQMNLTEFESSLNEYVEKLKQTKDEL